MVYYFKSNVVNPAAFIYVGKDKVENEELIKHGWNEDVWLVELRHPSVLHLELTGSEGKPIRFLRPYRRVLTPRTKKFHADKLSSAHIYLRLPEGQTWEDIPADLLNDCAQLTKANSIEGNKKDNVNVVYTPWSNLKKDGSMAVGQVGFKDQRKVKKVLVETRTNAIVNRLNKTKEEAFPDLAVEKEARLKDLRQREKQVFLERKKEEARIAKEHKEKAWQKDHAYDDIFTTEALEQNSNENRGADFYDDFL